MPQWMWILCGISAWKKRAVRESYNFTFVYALIYLLLTLVKCISCPLGWNNGFSGRKKKSCEFSQKWRKVFGFDHTKNVIYTHIDDVEQHFFLSVIKSRAGDTCMPTIIFPSLGYFIFFLRLSALIYRLYIERERKEADGESLFSIYRGQRYR